MVNSTQPKILDRETILLTLRDRKEIIDSFGVHSLALFGSTARNEATEQSDLDFLVEFEGMSTFDRYMDLKFFLEDLFNKPVDLVTKRSLKPQIRQTVLEEAIEIVAIADSREEIIADLQQSFLDGKAWKIFPLEQLWESIEK